MRKAAVKAAERLDPPSTSIFTPDTEFGSRLLIEVVRGCANLCRFCWAGYNYLPVRPFSTERILELAGAARPYANRVGLVSIALCDHPDIVMILERLVAMGYGISPASLRLDDLTEPIVRLLRESGERSITIAPETGSDRLRRVINKTVTNEQILDRAELIFASGLENLKLYYMIGLPTETDDDLVAIRDLTMEIRARMVGHARARGTLGRIVASVNPLVPKPGTTYQWAPMTDAATIERKADRVRSLVSGLENVYFNIKSERHSYYQGLLSLGDRRVADVIEFAQRNGGNWRAAVAESGIDAEAYLYRDRSDDAFLPWQIIDGGTKTTFFRSELEKSLRAEWTLPRAACRRRAAGWRRGSARRIAAPACPGPCRQPPAASRAVSHRFRQGRFVFLERLENDVAQPVLRAAVEDRPQQREAPPLTVDRVLPGGERHIASTGLALPNRESDQFQAVERPA